MMRRPCRPVPVAPVAPRHELLQLRTWAVFVTTAGMMVNEWLGPAVLVLALLLWGLYGVQHASSVARALGNVGIIPWLLPLLAFVSLLWSPVPLVTARSAVQFGLSIALAVLTAQAVPMRRFITSTWILSGILVVLSIVFNKPGYDFMTGRINMGGVFGNKNTLSFCCVIFTLSSITIFFDKKTVSQFRAYSLISVPISIIICLVAGSVSGVLAMILGIGVFIIIISLSILPRGLRSAAAEMIFLASLLASVPLMIGVITFQAELLTFVNKDSTLTGRTLLWYHAASMSTDHPILGTGYQGFWVQNTPRAEFLWEKLHIASRYGFHFHSLYYETLINLGYAGVTLGLLTIFQAISAALRWTRRSPNPLSGFCFAFILVVLLYQVQAVGLFSQFDLSSYIFFVCATYATGWCRQGLRPVRP